jgi:hypothetical protein
MMVGMSVQAAAEFILVFKGTWTIAENPTVTSRERTPPFSSTIFQTFWHSCGMAKKQKLSREQLDKKIRALQTFCRSKPGEKSIVLELLEDRRAEKELEDRDDVTLFSRNLG